LDRLTQQVWAPLLGQVGCRDGWNAIFEFGPLAKIDIPTYIVQQSPGGADRMGWRDNDGSPLPTTYHRTREGIERFFITDINNPAAGAQAQSELFVMWDAWSTGYNWGLMDPNLQLDPSSGIGYFNHIPGGSNVLYMDGHVEFIKYGSEDPINSPPNTHSNLNSQASLWVVLVGGFG